MFTLAPWEKKRSTAPLVRGESPFGWMREEFPVLFNRLFAGWPMLEMPEWPTGWEVTTEETEKEFITRMELPGFEPSELKLEVMGNRLTVEAEHKELAKKAEEAEEKAERAYVHAKRVLTLPPEVELEKLEATYRNGILEVHVPFKPEATGRRVEVKT